MVEKFYREKFWESERLDLAPNNLLASLALDFLVNSGSALGSKPIRDAAAARGVSGGKTVGELLSMLPETELESVAAEMLERRAFQYRKMKNYWKFGRGWEKRIGELKSFIPQEEGFSDKVKLAFGGMVEAIAGEAGPELVLPLNERGGGVIISAIKEVFAEEISGKKSASRARKFSDFFENRFLPELKRRMQ